MRISFLGAAEIVTGSNYLIEVDGLKVLVDCGMYQGGSEVEELNYKDFDFNPADIDYILLTHAHIDHSGRIPVLAKKGFKGKIITTKPTVELCQIMLPDSGFIQEMETEWTNRKRERAGKPPVEPLYKVADAMDSLKYFEGVHYNEILNLNTNFSVRFRNAGHILGSSILEIWVREKGEELKIVFSGDLGNKNLPLMQDPTYIEDADYVIMESTYGDRLHKETKNKALVLLDIITDTIEKKGNVVIPSFAVERTQEILYELNMLKELKTTQIRHIPVYVDSPLAINATKVFEANTDYLNEDAKSLILSGDNPFEFPNLIFTETADESRAINTSTGSNIIISASGMCDAGRIKHHLKHNLWRKESSIVFVGYQARGSLGRRIVDGEKTVKIFGEDINVKAKIYKIDGFSGHADQKGLLDWISSFKKKPTKVFLTHGEDEALTELSRILKEEYSIENQIAKLGQTIELTPSTQKCVVDTRYHAQKKTIIRSIAKLKASFAKVFEALENHINTYENIGIDALLHKVENVENSLDELKNEINGNP